MKLVSEHGCYGGVQRFYEHASVETATSMRFSVYLPAQAALEPVPAVVYLAGLTCNEETVMTKAGAQRHAAELGIALISPDTSPRGPVVEAIPGSNEHWDFGIGAGFYLDATAQPWAKHWRMESYIVRELMPLLLERLPLRQHQLGIFGHSMGGHGALTLALRHPEVFRSVSAFAPVAAPTQCVWGKKAFANYLGEKVSDWQAHDASELMRRAAQAPFPAGILIDQGLHDKFLMDNQLLPDRFVSACEAAGQALTLRRHAGYDHGYYFISTFMRDHLLHHERQLRALTATDAADAFAV